MSEVQKIGSFGDHNFFIIFVHFPTDGLFEKWFWFVHDFNGTDKRIKTYYNVIDT